MLIHGRPLIAAIVVAALGTGLGLGVGAADAASGTGRTPVAAPAMPQTATRPAVPTTVYVAVPSCKIATITDFRGGNGQSLAVTGSDLSNQGGSRTGCRIPDYATSIAGRITATNVTTSGSAALSAFGVGPNGPSVFLTKGTSTESGFTQGIAPTTAGGLNLTLNDTAGRGRITVWINGYYAQQPEGTIFTGDGGQMPPQFYNASTGLVSVTRVGVGVVDVNVDRDISNCAATATSAVETGWGATAFPVADRTVRIEQWIVENGGTVQDADGPVNLSIVC